MTALNSAPDTPQPTPRSRRGHRRREGHSSGTPIIGLAAVAVATVAPIVVGAGLLFDGGWFFLNAVSTGEAQVVQNRLTFAVQTWPTALATRHIQSLDVLLAIFTFCLAITPFLTFAASWWVARRRRPSLILWPALGILLLDLPGQMHWVATSIRTNQLLWPVLIAVLCGLPYGTLPIVVVCTFLAVNMHPQAAPYLWFLAVTAAVVAWRTPEARRRLLPAAVIFALFGVYRYALIEGNYAAHESSLSNQISQFRSAVWGWPLVLVIATGIVGAIFAFLPRRILDYTQRPRSMVFVPALLIIVALPFMVRWATDPAQWRSVINYRGPSFWLTLILMTFAVADGLRGHHSGRPRSTPTGPILGTTELSGASRRSSIETPRTPLARLVIANVAGCVFAIVIIAQCVSFHGQRNQLEAAITRAHTACIPSSAIPHFADNPLNFWALPAASLMLQSKTPAREVAPDALCAKAKATGQPVYATIDEPPPTPSYMSFSTLTAGLSEERPCRVHFGAAWLVSSRAGASGAGTLLEPIGSAEVDLDLSGPATVNLALYLADSGRRLGAHPIPVSVTVDGSIPIELAPVKGRSGRFAGAVQLGSHAHRIRITNTTDAPVMALDPTVSLAGNAVACSS